MLKLGGNLDAVAPNDESNSPTPPIL